MSFGTRLRALAKRLLPRALLLPAARLEQRWNAARFVNRQRGLTDYRVNFDYRNLRKAKAVILWHDDWEKATAATLDIVDTLGLVHAGDTVIDYGCGIGRMTRALSERHAVTIIAVDRSAAMRDHARAYLEAALRGGMVQLLSDLDLLERTPQLRARISCILMIEVLQHIPEPVLEGLLPQLAALLAPNGRLLVFGSDVLDVDRAGRPGSPIEPVLARLLRIERRDRWTTGFVHPRHSFVCSQRNI
ncbi:MAG TPA: class I SAM-dependent methyltransferase [Candidatus Dormibacteraeota bacterium]|nr:class I SAM-dependent methyltransferase [Candidatus Dormibacteraeota bacterium]